MLCPPADLLIRVLEIFADFLCVFRCAVDLYEGTTRAQIRKVRNRPESHILWHTNNRFCLHGGSIFFVGGSDRCGSPPILQYSECLKVIQRLIVAIKVL